MHSFCRFFACREVWHHSFFFLSLFVLFFSLELREIWIIRLMIACEKKSWRSRERVRGIRAQPNFIIEKTFQNRYECGCCSCLPAYMARNVFRSERRTKSLSITILITIYRKRRTLFWWFLWRILRKTIQDRVINMHVPSFAEWMPYTSFF